jgi:8-oxo-dGTP pyrophosphatase MutT (NUDIX family)
MEKQEIWDAYNADGTLAGVDLVRGEKIPEGLRHAVAEVFVLHQDGTILLMKRDTNKPNYPGYWESGAGGAVLKGERFLVGAKRELKEETGISAIDFEPIYRVVTDNTIYQGYVCHVDIRKELIKLQQGETIDYKWVNKTEFNEIYKSEVFVSSLRERLNNFVSHDFSIERDCSFQSGSQWFRYRAAAIIIENGEVLMAKNDIDDYFYTIGGGVHLGETAEQAVQREVFEETGVKYEVERLAFINECFFHGDGSLSGKECHVIEFYFLMKPKGNKELNSNSMTQGVVEYMCWLPIDKIGEYKAFPLFFINELQNIKNGIRHFVSDER